LQGSSIGHALLNPVPSRALARSGRRALDNAYKIAHPKFRLASSSFVVFAARASDFAAVQRGWRDFRMAQ
jgi:hypothetical protein